MMNPENKTALMMITEGGHKKALLKIFSIKSKWFLYVCLGYMFFNV